MGREQRVERDGLWRVLNLCVGYRTDMVGMGKYPLFQLKGGDSNDPLHKG
jgi:hypothetical protein